MNTPTTRLAPSPTGALHLGNARTFLINWAIARRSGHKILLRVEDLDGPRVKTGAAAAAVEDLRWLGLDWDEGPFYQRHDLSPYRAALKRLDAKGLIYPCRCTRREIRSAHSAPHRDDHEIRYPGTCRPQNDPCANSDQRPAALLDGSPDDTVAAWRLRVPDEPIAFTDQLQGPQSIAVQQQTGDFVVATKRDLPSYQLAVVVDDARQGITHIVRGDDLIRSTHRQLWLYRLLDLSPTPNYLHLPLVVGPDGRRLAKRHGDSRLAWYRQRGVGPQRVVGLIARWCGLVDGYTTLDAAEFADRFDLGALSRSAVTLTAEDHAWLLAP